MAQRFVFSLPHNSCTRVVSFKRHTHEAICGRLIFLRLLSTFARLLVSTVTNRLGCAATSPVKMPVPVYVCVCVCCGFAIIDCTGQNITAFPRTCVSDPYASCCAASKKCTHHNPPYRPPARSPSVGTVTCCGWSAVCLSTALWFGQ